MALERMRVARLKRGLTAAVLVMVLAPGLASADPVDAEDLIRRANVLRRQNRPEPALQLVRDAYDMAPIPRMAAHYGFCLEDLSRFLEAEQRLEESLRATNDPWVRNNRGTIESSLNRVRQRLATVIVRGPFPNANVKVFDRLVPLGTPARVPAGSIRVVLQPLGVDREREWLADIAPVECQMISVNRDAPPVVSLSSGCTSTPAGKNVAAIGTTTPVSTPPPVNPTVQESRDSTPPAAGLPPSGPSVATDAGSRIAVNPPATSEGGPTQLGATATAPASRDWTKVTRPATFAAGGVAVAALIYSLYQHHQWRTRIDEFDRYRGDASAHPVDPMTGPGICGDNEPARGGPGCADLYSRLDSSHNKMLIGYTISGISVGLAAAVGLLWKFYPSETGTHASRVVCTPVAGTETGGSCSFVF
jgi:hypothetical protein